MMIIKLLSMTAGLTMALQGTKIDAVHGLVFMISGAMVFSSGLLTAIMEIVREGGRKGGAAMSFEPEEGDRDE